MILPLPVEKEMIILRDKNFSSKAQKQRIKAMRLARTPEVKGEPFTSLEIGLKRELGTDATAKRIGKDSDALLGKVSRTSLVNEAAKVSEDRMKERWDTSHNDKLAEKQTAGGMKDYKAGLKERAAELKARKVKRAEESAKSIAKHEVKAAELRAKKALGQKIKTAGKVGLGVAATAGIGYGIKKAVDKNKNKDGKEK